MTRLSSIICSVTLLVVPAVQSLSQVVDIAPSRQEISAPFSSADEDAFKNPPKVYMPQTWFHFIGGNISKEGVDADLEAISKAGLSGIQWFHGNFGGRWPSTDTSVVSFSPLWEETVEHMSRKAEELGLRLSIQTCPGWAMAGGPWIEPENAMRDLVWSRTDIAEGGSAEKPLPKGSPSSEEWRDYRDICVLAFPTPLGDTGEWLHPVGVLSDDPLWKKLLENDLKEGYHSKEGSVRSATFSLPEGQIIRTIVLQSVNSYNHHFVYEPGIHVSLSAVGKDGKETTVLSTDLPSTNWQDDDDLFLACNEVEDVDHYELKFSNKNAALVTMIRFLSAARKNSWKGEAGWSLVSKEFSQEHTEQNPLCFIDPDDILDLSRYMDSGGNLDWKAPEGKGSWTVLRIGNVNSGQRNGPATKEATGWECNKFDPRGAETQFANYVGKLYDGPLGGRASGMLMDSWECRTQTWTATMEEDFRKSAGYPLRNMLPALMGYVIGSQEATSRFLIDWRRNVTGLYVENFFRKMVDQAHEKGMKVQYETAGGDVVTMDPLEYYKYADVPMCEFWQPFSSGYVGSLDFKPIKPTASAAHIYGKPRVAAESFTSFSLTWDEHWEMLKEVANLNMAEGVTHNVFHTYTHNPQVGFLPPGTSFGSSIGTPFLRGQTWWKYMPEFTTYLARKSYMLERGLPVVDVLWYLGDEVLQRPDQLFEIHEGIKYDYCNPDALVNRMWVKDGKIRTPEGIAYSVLWIPENERMLPQTLKTIRKFLRKGATVISDAPLYPATLYGGKKTERKFDRLVKSIWGKAESGKINKIGKGKLVCGMEVGEAVEALGIKPRLIAEGGKVLWNERIADGATWFFVAAPVGGPFRGKIKFLAQGDPEIWSAVDGSRFSAEADREGDYISIDLDLLRSQNCFVVFRTDDHEAAPIQEKPSKGENLAIESWSLGFPEGWGVPENLELKDLAAWKDLNISKEGKAFSGTATYKASFEAPDAGRIFLNLGEVDMIADVKVNGLSAGVLWAHPYVLDISSLVREGTNTLEIDVTGTWHNRLTYDASLPRSERKTWTIGGPSKESPMTNSGLLGPVMIEY